MAKTKLCYCLFLLLVVAGHATAGSTVKFLPGFLGPLPFELETGVMAMLGRVIAMLFVCQEVWYVGVGDSEDVQLFYYFIKSESNPESDPLMLWVTGGPGCSALSGLIYEIGPITFEPMEYNGMGTGFSYATTPTALQSSDLQASDHAHQFLHKWFADHPEFLSNPLYVGGDSYSGMSYADWYKLSYHWADDGQVRDALSIRKGTIGKWDRCATLQYQKTVINSIPYHENLSNKDHERLLPSDQLKHG
ncbi:serine carboxypeptidase-like 17 [Capsicum chacoense]